MARSYKEYLSSVTTFVFKMGGVLASAEIALSLKGEPQVSFHLKDLYAIKQCARNGIRVILLNDLPEFSLPEPWAQSKTVEVANVPSAQLRDIPHLFELLRARPEEVLFMGYDNPDLHLAKAAAVATCPADASMEMKQHCQYVSTFKGGAGSVRDVVEQTLRVKGIWAEP